MFDLNIRPDGHIALTGRLDASQADKAKMEFDKVSKSTVVDFKDLEYISSAGLGVLFATQKRLKDAGQGLKLVNMNQHIRDVFRYARFDLIFEIE
ncbi:MAG TPA: STAS domain-containing protein [Bacteroidota bacterium]|nr:STAS domain-containing protein [Bacteroidota bacterium]